MFNGPIAAPLDCSDAPEKSEPKLPTVPCNIPFKDAKQQILLAFEGIYLAQLMRDHDGNISAASRAAGLTRRHLRDLLRRHDLYRRPEPHQIQSGVRSFYIA